MITVRFPSGFSVQYNDLTAMKWGSDGSIQLYTDYAKADAGKGWKVTVPPGALVEFVSPCRTYNASADKANEEIYKLVREVRLLKRTIAKLARGK